MRARGARVSGPGSHLSLSGAGTRRPAPPPAPGPAARRLVALCSLTRGRRRGRRFLRAAGPGRSRRRSRAPPAPSRAPPARAPAGPAQQSRAAAPAAASGQDAAALADAAVLRPALGAGHRLLHVLRGRLRAGRGRGRRRQEGEWAPRRPGPRARLPPPPRRPCSDAAAGRRGVPSAPPSCSAAPGPRLGPPPGRAAEAPGRGAPLSSPPPPPPVDVPSALHVIRIVSAALAPSPAVGSLGVRVPANTKGVGEEGRRLPFQCVTDGGGETGPSFFPAFWYEPPRIPRLPVAPGVGRGRSRPCAAYDGLPWAGGSEATAPCAPRKAGHGHGPGLPSGRASHSARRGPAVPRGTGLPARRPSPAPLARF